MATISYDPLFQKYAARFFLAVQIDGKPFDWRWLHAQAMAESGLDPRAHSPAGAMGLMQLMPATFSECVRALGLPAQASPWDPDLNIHCGAWYLRRMWGIFKEESDLTRLCFAFGAYNAGAGNIIRAQTVAVCQGKDPSSWSSIISGLPQITGSHAQETIGYVRRILRNYEEMQEGLE